MPKASLLNSGLEIQFESELQNTRSGRGAFDASETCARNIVVRIGVIYPVENIERFETQFAAKLFAERNHFNQRKINIFLSRSGKTVSQSIAERICRIERRIVCYADTVVRTGEKNSADNCPDRTRTEKRRRVEIRTESLRIRTARINVAGKAVIKISSSELRRCPDCQQSKTADLSEKHRFRRSASYSKVRSQNPMRNRVSEARKRR